MIQQLYFLLYSIFPTTSFSHFFLHPFLKQFVFFTIPISSSSLIFPIHAFTSHLFADEIDDDPQALYPSSISLDIVFSLLIKYSIILNHFVFHPLSFTI